MEKPKILFNKKEIEKKEEKKKRYSNSSSRLTNCNPQDQDESLIIASAVTYLPCAR